jgi:hypothetical protein
MVEDPGTRNFDGLRGAPSTLSHIETIHSFYPFEYAAKMKSVFGVGEWQEAPHFASVVLGRCVVRIVD